MAALITQERCAARACPNPRREGSAFCADCAAQLDQPTHDQDCECATCTRHLGSGQ